MTSDDSASLPLVSVCVITYNSSKYILDTLDSIKKQTYPNIELIIGDDCSTDNTCALVNDWIEKNRTELSHIKFLQNEKNMGVSYNANRVRNNSTGKWIKGVAGDDQLLPNSIAGYMDFVERHPDAEICFGKLQFFSYDSRIDLDKIRNDYETNFYARIKLPLKKQQKEILKSLFIPGPGTFYSKRLFDLVGGFDEKYPYCEEDPFYNRILSKGYRVHFIDKELFRYNIRYDSLCRGSSLKLHEKDRMRYFFDERFGLMLKKGLWMNGLNTYLLYKSVIEQDKGHIFMSKLYGFPRKFCAVLYRSFCGMLRKQ